MADYERLGCQVDIQLPQVQDLPQEAPNSEDGGGRQMCYPVFILSYGRMEE